MFGIALWDRTRRTLLLARDRAGIKPLHFVEHGSRIYFGSEIKSLIATGAVPREIDFEALDHYLSYLCQGIAPFQVRSEAALGHFLRWRNGQDIIRIGKSAASSRFAAAGDAARAQDRPRDAVDLTWSATFRSGPSCRAGSIPASWWRSWPA